MHISDTKIVYIVGATLSTMNFTCLYYSDVMLCINRQSKCKL